MAVGLADRDKDTVGLSAAVAYLVFAGTIAVLLEKFSAEDASIDTGVLGALVIGLIVTRLHNKYRQKQDKLLPQKVQLYPYPYLQVQLPHR